jgi:hypothetical protein
MAKDTCIMCGKETAYEFETHIDYRIGYVEGAGQLCKSCYDNIPTTPSNYITIPEDLIKNTPNDMELGNKIRSIYWENLK